jgi:hypothetical protein
MQLETNSPRVAAVLDRQAPQEASLPPGVLVEISGPEARRRAAQILIENQALPAAWIEQDLEALPGELFRSRLDFQKVLFINGRENSAWALSCLVKSGEFSVVVFYAPYENERFLRRLRREAKKARCTVLLLRAEPCFSWTIRAQLRAADGALDALRWRRE